MPAEKKTRAFVSRQNTEERAYEIRDREYDPFIFLPFLDDDSMLHGWNATLCGR